MSNGTPQHSGIGPYPVDHDQQDPLNTGSTANLPARTWLFGVSTKHSRATCLRRRCGAAACV